MLHEKNAGAIVIAIGAVIGIIAAITLFLSWLLEPTKESVIITIIAVQSNASFPCFVCRELSKGPWLPDEPCNDQDPVSPCVSGDTWHCTMNGAMDSCMGHTVTFTWSQPEIDDFTPQIDDCIEQVFFVCPQDKRKRCWPYKPDNFVGQALEPIQESCTMLTPGCKLELHYYLEDEMPWYEGTTCMIPWYDADNS